MIRRLQPLQGHASTHSVDFERLAAGHALYIMSGQILCFILRFTYIQLRLSHWVDGVAYCIIINLCFIGLSVYLTCYGKLR